MITIDFTEKEINELKRERFSNSSSRIQLKLEALYLKSKGLKHRQICDICQISNATLATYLKTYISGGINALKGNRYKGKRNQLMENSEIIKKHFAKHPPNSIKEAAIQVEKLTGIKRSSTQIWKFLQQIK